MDDLSSTDSENTQTIDKFSLKERNSILEQENLSLKSQIDDAVNITSRLESLQAQNLRLSQEVINLKTNNDNIHCRLQISLQTNTDLLKSFETQKKNFAIQIQNEKNVQQNEAGKLKEKYQGHIDSIYGELEQVKAQNDSLQVAQKVLTNKIQRALEAAEQYFHLKFPTLDDLNTVLKQPTITSSSEQSTAQTTLPLNNQQGAEMMQVIRNLRKKLKTAKKETQKAEETLQDSENSYKREISAIQRKIEQIQNDKNENDSNYENKIKELKEKISELKSNLDDAKLQLKKKPSNHNTNNNNNNLPNCFNFDQTSPISQQGEIPPMAMTRPAENISENRRDKTDEYQIEQLNSRISELTHQMSSVQAKANDSQDQVRKSEMELQNAELKMAKLQNNYNSLEIVHKESLAEIESLRKSLHERQQGLNPKDTPIIIQESADKKLLNKKEVKISELQNEIHKKDIENEDLESKVRELETSLSNKSDEMRKLKQEFDEYMFRTESRHNVTADDLLPPGSFRYSNFDAKLMAEIDKIALNSSLQLPSKLEHCFRSIEAHYKGQITELQYAYQDLNTESVYLRTKIRQLITDASITLVGSPIALENDISASIDCLHKVITDFNANHIKVSREHDQLQTIVAHFATVLETDDVITKIDQYKGQMTQVTKRYILLKRKNKALAAENSRAQDNLKNETSRLENELEISQTKCNDLENKSSAQNEQIKKLRLSIKNLQNDLANSEEAKKELEATLKESADDELGSLNSKYKQLESQFNSKITNLQMQVASLQEENAALQSKISNLDSINRSNQNKINNLNTEKFELNREKDDMVQSMNSKFESEKISLKKSFDTTFNELKKQNEKCREDIEQLSKCMAKKDEALNEQQKQLKILSISKAKASSEIRSLNEQIGREKKLAEATTKSQICSLETKYKEKIEIIKAQSVEEQQKMVLYVVDAFRTIFCGFVGKIEDRSFRSLVDRIKEQYGKLLESDQAIRRMLNLQERQTTQDAVAQLLINH